MNSFIALIYRRLSEHVDNKYTFSYSSFIDQIKLLKSTNYIIEGFNGLEKRLVSNNCPKNYVNINHYMRHLCSGGVVVASR